MSWFAKADFWSLFYDWMFPAESFDQAREQVDDIIKLTGVSAGAVLDLGCGPGRHSVPLSKAGFQVTAVDLQPVLLDKARELAARENATIQFIQDDMRSFRRVESFDLALSMFSSFGYFEDSAEDFRVLENVYCPLKSGGRFLIHLRGKEVHAKGFTETMSSQNGDLIFQRTPNSDDWTRALTTWVYVSGHRADSFEVTLNLYSGAELRDLLRRAGFRNVRLYGDLEGSPYDQNATRLIAVAEKE